MARTPGSYGRRLAAALAYRGWTADDLARALSEDERNQFSLSKSSIDRITQGRREARSILEVELLADRLGVPEWFLRDGFEGQPDVITISERLEAIESALARLADLVGARERPAAPTPLSRR